MKKKKGKIAILIVEDDAVLGENYREGLNELGYKISDICATGENAVKRARETMPDIILMDIKLKGEMDGIEAYKQIYGFLEVPVIYLTAYIEDKIRDLAGKTFPDGFLIKPARIEEIHQAIQKALFKNE